MYLRDEIPGQARNDYVMDALTLILITVFRMVVIPVEFEDRGFAAGRGEQEWLVQQAESYFNRQFNAGTINQFSIEKNSRTKASAEGTKFQFVLGPGVKLGHECAAGGCGAGGLHGACGAGGLGAVRQRRGRGGG